MRTLETESSRLENEARLMVPMVKRPYRLLSDSGFFAFIRISSSSLSLLHSSLVMKSKRL